MITQNHMRTMARYNSWQNQNIYRAADGLSDELRQQDRGAFFNSIHGTLSHLMWADQMWMHRFADTPKPAGGISQSAQLFSEWDAMKTQRVALDAQIQEWADTVDPAWIVENMTWFSGAAQREFTMARWQLVTHFFNHQTHHRGQIHAMLTAAGAKPDDTDLILLPV